MDEWVSNVKVPDPIFNQICEKIILSDFWTSSAVLRDVERGLERQQTILIWDETQNL